MNYYGQTPIYTNVTDAKATSTVLSALTNDQVTALINRAQYAIDAYIVSYGEKADEDQSFIFPTVDNGVPSEIGLACILTSEYLSQGAGTGKKNVASESNLSRSVTYVKQTNGEYMDESQFPITALQILKKYRNNFYSQAI